MKICPACSREYPDERTHCERDRVMLVALTTGASGKAEDLVGQTVDGRYLIEGIVGRGGMGTVYACRHVVVGKPFAMKVVRPGTDQTSDVLQRFIREAQTANSIRSRHIVEMTDFGQLPSGQFYMTMELLEGMDLGKALKRGLSGQQLLHIFIQCADVLDVTHQRGVVHRDLKPDNIFLVQEDNDPLFVKLLDFGIAKALHAGPSGLTETGVVLGTPYYMSPEQARGADVDHRTDIYSLGVIMYRAFAGKLPFVADSAVGVLTRHLTEAPELPSLVGGVPPDIERVILTCLEKRPESRYPSMGALAQSLRAILAQRHPGAAQPRPVTQQGDQSYAQLAASQQGPAASGAYGARPQQTPNPYAPPPALSASQQNPAVSGFPNDGAAGRASAPYAPNPYAPPPALSASQQSPAAGASGARPVSFTGAQQAAAMGGQPTRPVSYNGLQQGPSASGAYAQQSASGPQLVSGAYAQPSAQTASGPYAQAPQAASGAYAQAAPQAVSGAYAQAAPQTASGPHPQASMQGGPPSASGAYAQAGAAGAPQGAGPASQGFGAPGALGNEWTAHGLAASQAMQAQQPRKSWPFVAGALGMLAIGGVVAFTLLRSPSSDAGAMAASGQATTSTAASGAPATSASAAPSASASATAAASDAPSSAPAGSTTAAAASGTGPAGKPTGAVPKSTATPKATASASASTTTTKRPEIRSPFD